ncbi:type VI secretion system-associated protein TagF [Agrobacterium vitis]
MALRPAQTEKPAGQDRIGFFGKLPSHGDFLSEGLEREMVATLDGWIRGGLHACEQEFGAAWPELFSASPLGGSSSKKVSGARWRMLVSCWPAVIGSVAVFR